MKTIRQTKTIRAMKGQRLLIGVLLLGLLLAPATGLVLAQGPGPQGDDTPQDHVGTAFTYQGRLKDASGLVNRTCDFRFSLWDALSGGAQVGTTQTETNVMVSEGLFTVQLNGNDEFGWSAFRGDARWLQIAVCCPAGGGTYATLSPRQPLTAAPYALALKPGAVIHNKNSSGGMSGIYFMSDHGNGVTVYSAFEDGVYVDMAGSPSSRPPSTARNGFEVAGAEGAGLYVGRADWDGVFVKSTAQSGLAVESADNRGVWVWSAGDDGVYVHQAGSPSTTNASATKNGFEVAGAEGYGLYVGRANASGVYVSSAGTYGVAVNAADSYGVYANTTEASHNYGLYTLDNLYSLNYHLAGAVMHVAQNGGTEPLEPGDVVVFSGLAAPLEKGGAPLIQVARAPGPSSTAVAGVVYSRFDIAATQEAGDSTNSQAGREVTPAGPVPPQEYLLVVIQGPAQVKASAVAGPIQPGDLLSSASQAGRAAKAAEVSLGGVKTAPPGTVFGKALEPLDKGDGLIYVFVTLQ